MNIIGPWLIHGPPGTGKTTRLAAAVGNLLRTAGGLRPDGSSPVSVCSLTRAAAAEISGREIGLPRDHLGTVHSLAWRALAEIGGKPILVDDKKLEEFRKYAPVHKIEVALGAAPDPDDWRRSDSGEKNIYAGYHLLRVRMTPREVWPGTVSSFAKDWEEWKRISGYVDFTDLLDRALAETDSPPGRPDYIIVDEAQDFSALENALIRHWAERAKAVIYAGDPHQAIYEWRGADPHAFDAFPLNRVDVLKKSYRLPRAVHMAAERWIKNLSNYRNSVYEPRDAAGVVENRDDLSTPDDIAMEAADRASEGKTVMISATFSAALEPIIRRLRAAGEPFANPWRTHASAWNPLGRRKGKTSSERLAAFLKPAHTSHTWTQEDVAAFSEILESGRCFLPGWKRRWSSWAETDPTKKIKLSEFAQSLSEEPAAGLWAASGEADLLRWFRHWAMPSVMENLEYPLRVAESKGAKTLSEPPRLFVGTVHSFKGGEADVVYLLTRLAYPAVLEGGSEDHDPTIRLLYTGITRAREELHAIQAGGIEIL